MTEPEAPRPSHSSDTSHPSRPSLPHAAGREAGRGDRAPAVATGPAPASAPAAEADAPSRVDCLLESARSGLTRLTAEAAARARRDEGALLVDIRYAALREQDGTIPGALIVERNELEWRLDPTCPHRSPEAFPSARGTREDAEAFGLPVVVVCNEGYASSLAARSLRELGLYRATDLDGGFQAWRAAGLPVATPGTRPGARAAAGT